MSACVGAATAESTRVTAGADDSFDAFFAAEYPRLLRLLSAADVTADDALQEAFAKAALAWRRISEYEDPAGWVRLVAVRRLLDQRRSERRRRAAVDRLEASATRAVRDPDTSIDLGRAIDALSPQQRVALTLFYLGGLTSEEAGEAMGITAGAVRFHLHEARARLRERMEVRDA